MFHKIRRAWFNLKATNFLTKLDIYSQEDLDRLIKVRRNLRNDVMDLCDTVGDDGPIFDNESEERTVGGIANQLFFEVDMLNDMGYF